MTCKFNYRTVSLKISTYSMLNDLSKTLVPGIQLSNAKTVEKLILDTNKNQCNSSRDINLKECNEIKKNKSI